MLVITKPKILSKKHTLINNKISIEYTKFFFKTKDYNMTFGTRLGTLIPKKPTSNVFIFFIYHYKYSKSLLI